MKAQKVIQLRNTHTSAIKMFDSGTVGVFGKLVHGSMHVGEEEGECRDPEVAQLLPWPKSGPHLRGKLVVVMSDVPHKPSK